jgi:hypothetical protein
LFHRCAAFQPSTVALSSNRLQKQNAELRNSGILEMLTIVASEAYGGEFAQESEALTPKNTIHGRNC